jgi:tetrahydromethanopterin S-methyltransferase subunit G
VLNALEDISMNFTANLFNIEKRIRNTVDGRDIGIFYGTILEVSWKY